MGYRSRPRSRKLAYALAGVSIAGYVGLAVFYAFSGKLAHLVGSSTPRVVLLAVVVVVFVAICAWLVGRINERP